jgi:hypothetical protein
LYPTYELVHVVLAQVSGEPLDLIGGVIGVLGNRPLALLSQLLAGLSERRLYGGHPLGGLVLLVRQLGLDLLAAPVRQLSGLLTGLLGELLCLLLRLLRHVTASGVLGVVLHSHPFLAAPVLPLRRLSFVRRTSSSRTSTSSKRLRQKERSCVHLRICIHKVSTN